MYQLLKGRDQRPILTLDAFARIVAEQRGLFHQFAARNQFRFAVKAQDCLSQHITAPNGTLGKEPGEALNEERLHQAAPPCIANKQYRGAVSREIGRKKN